MTGQSYWGKFYWSARQEDVGESAARVSRLLNSLASIDQAFDQWQIVAESGDIRPLNSLNQQELIEALQAGRNRNDLDGRPIGELGFSIGLSNKTTRIQTTIGGYSQWVPNNFIIGPISGTTSLSLCQLPIMSAIVRVIVEHFDPDHGVITSEQYDDLVYDYDDPSFTVKIGQPRSGWIVYVSQRCGLRADVNTNVIEDYGQLFFATDEPFDSAITEHVESANRIWKNLTAC